jgi:hypothetical protein
MNVNGVYGDREVMRDYEFWAGRRPLRSRRDVSDHEREAYLLMPHSYSSPFCFSHSCCFFSIS